MILVGSVSRSGEHNWGIEMIPWLVQTDVGRDERTHPGHCRGCDHFNESVVRVPEDSAAEPTNLPGPAATRLAEWSTGPE